MLDIQFIKENPDLVRAALKNKNREGVDLDRVLVLADERKSAAVAAMGAGLARAGQTYSQAAQPPAYIPPRRINCSSRSAAVQPALKLRLTSSG